METLLRNSLRLAITSCRLLLDEDYLLQLEGRYGIRRDGQMEPLEQLEHLDAIGLAERRAIEPARAWDELLRVKYAWSHIASCLRQKKLVKGIS